MEIISFEPPPGFTDLLLDAVCVVDAEGHFVYISAACERIFGYTQVELIGRNMIDLVAPEDRERTLEAAGKIMAGDLQFHFENRYVRKDGQLAHIMWTARWSEKDQLRIAVARDITERKHAESMQAALYEISEALHAAEGLPDLCAKIHRIIDALLPARNFYVGLHESASGALAFPYQAEEEEPLAPLAPACAALYAELIRTGQPLLLTPETLGAFPAEMQALIDCNTQSWLAVPLKSQTGVVGAVFLKSHLAQARYTERHKELLRYVSTQIASAVERMQLHARLQYNSHYDALTDLPNRALFYDRLNTALARVRRSGERMSLLYLDLDKFKQVNDEYGHATGDALLREVGRRLKRCMRDSDTVARIGGDEFAVLLENPRSAEDTAAVANNIRDVLSQPMEIEGRSLRTLPSIGIAIYPDHGQSAQQLLKHADEAMYLAKRSVKFVT